MEVAAECDRLLDCNAQLRELVLDRELETDAAYDEVMVDLKYAQKCLDEEEAAAAAPDGDGDVPTAAPAIAAPDGIEVAEAKPVAVPANAAVAKDDPRHSREALLQLYCQLHCVTASSIALTYKNYLTSATMSIDDPNGKHVAATVRIPGKPEKQRLRDKVISALMGLCYPGKTTDQILDTLEQLRQKREELKRQRNRERTESSYRGTSTSGRSTTSTGGTGAGRRAGGTPEQQQPNPMMNLAALQQMQMFNPQQAAMAMQMQMLMQNPLAAMQQQQMMQMQQLMQMAAVPQGQRPAQQQPQQQQPQQQQPQMNLGALASMFGLQVPQGMSTGGAAAAPGMPGNSLTL